MLEAVAALIEFEVASGNFRTFGFLVIDVLLLIMVIFHAASDQFRSQHEVSINAQRHLGPSPSEWSGLFMGDFWSRNWKKALIVIALVLFLVAAYLLLSFLLLSVD